MCSSDLVMKALEKDRNRRYETANGLGRDIERYLQDEPVQACPPSAGYRLRKWVRRHRAVMLTAAALAAVLVAVAVGATVAAFREQRLRRDAQESATSERAARKELERTLYFELIALADQRLAADNRDQVYELLEQCPAHLRGWEWSYLKHWLQAEPYLELRGHTKSLTSVAFHSDGRRLASGAADRTIRIWDWSPGKQARPPLYGHSDTVLGVAFSRDGRYLASASMDQTVKIWDADTGELIRTLRDHEGGVTAVTFSPDSRLLASSSTDKSVRIWEAATGRPIQTWRGHEAPVSGVAFSPDGRRLASLGVNGTVKIWDVASGRETLSWRESPNELANPAFSPDGQYLAVPSSREIHIRNVTDGRLARALRGHGDGVNTVAFSPDGRRLASTSADNTAKLWDPDTGREILTFRGHTDVVQDIAFSPDGCYLATASFDQTIKIWEATGSSDVSSLLRTVCILRDGNPTCQLTNRFIAYHPDGWRFAAGYDDGAVRLWDLGTGREAGVFRIHDLPIHASAFSPDGSLLTAGDHNGDLKVWDVATSRELWACRGGSAPGPGVPAISPDNRWLIFAGWNPAVLTVHDGRTGTPLKELRHAGDLLCVDFSPDGRLLASCGTSRSVKVWKTDGFQEFLTLEHADAILSMRFSRDGRRLVTGSADKNVRV